MSAQHSPLLDPSCDCGLLGAVRALVGIEKCAVIVHGRPGCHSGMLGLMSYCSSHRRVNIVFSGLRSEDMIYGGEKRLLNAILNTYKIMKPDLIAICCCSAVGIMGDDVQGVVQEAKDRYGIDVPIIILEAYGYKTREQQLYELALQKLADLAEPGVKQEPNLVNVIGFRPDQPHWRADLEEIRRILEANGVRVNLVLSWCSVSDIRKIARASLNVVLGGDGVLLAEELRRRFNIPYVIVPYPYGIENTLNLIHTVCKELGINPNEDFIEKERQYVEDVLQDFLIYLDGVYKNLDVALIGEASRVFSLAQFLKKELGLNIELICARCSSLVIDRLSSGWKCKILVEPDRYDLEKELENLEIDLIFGSTYDRLLALKLGVGLVRMFFPSFDEVTISTRPAVGFRGVLTIIEKIINEALRLQEKRELAYLAKLGATRFTAL